MGRRKTLKESTYVIFRAEKETYEDFKKVCYEKIGVTPSDLFRAFMESILTGEKSIVISRRPVHTAITITKTKDVEMDEIPFNVGDLILSEQIRINISDLRRAMERRAPPDYIRSLRDKLLDICKKAKALDPLQLKELKQALAEVREFLKEEEIARVP